MNKSAQAQLIIGIILLLIVVIGGIFFFFIGDSSSSGTDLSEGIPEGNNALQPSQGVSDPEVEEVDETVEEPVEEEPEQPVEEEPVEEEPEEEMMDNTIEFTSANGYEPNEITISVGDVVTFVNKDPTKTTWPASDIHPTHTVYPESNINKCGTEDAPNIFDACKGLQENEEYSFIFNEAGEWEYHDHLSAGKKGTIIVE
jgi:plastocyanin